MDAASRSAGAAGARDQVPAEQIVSQLWLPALDALYPWARAVDRPQSWYLNESFFVVRALLFLLSWSALALWVQRPPPARRRGPVLALLWLGLSGSLAGIDWAMSLTPEHHAAGFGLLTISGWVLGAMALAVGASATTVENESIRADHGAWLLMLLLLWAYLAYMDYLTAWIGDQPSALAWYWPRVGTEWSRWMERFSGSCPEAAGFAALFIPVLRRFSCGAVAGTRKRCRTAGRARARRAGRSSAKAVRRYAGSAGS